MPESEKQLRAPRPPAIHTHFSKSENQNVIDSSTSTSSTSRKHEIPRKTRMIQPKWQWPSSLAWVPANWSWMKIRLALRCAIAAWISSVLFVIPAVQVWIGQASFLLLIAAFLSPPIDPFLAVLEREVLISLFVAATWAFACLGMFLANLARTNLDTSVSIQTALFSNGQYVEAAPSAILAIFIFIGTAILLYIRVHQGPGPYLFATLFSCICLITNLTTAVLVPYPYYILGRAIFIPLVFHSIISILASIILFPESLSNNFTKRVAAVFTPLQKATTIHLTLLRTTPGGDCVEEFKGHIDSLAGVVAQSEAALGPLAQAARLLPSEVVYSRYSPRDWRPLQDLARRVAVRANGMSIYFTLIDPTRERFPTTRPGTPAGTSPSTPVERHSEPPHHHHLSNLLHRAHLHNSNRFHHRASSSYGNRHTSHAPVGVFESQRYLDLEAHVWHDPRTESHTTQTHNLLQESCTPLLEQCQSATACLQSWFAGAAARDGTSWRLAKGILSSALLSTAAQIERRENAKQLEWEKRVSEIRIVREKLEEELIRFRTVARMNVVKPYTDALDPVDSPISAEDSNHWNYEYNQLPSHRYLFNCYVYQYHLMRFADMLGELLDHVIRLETRPERRHRRVWTPKFHNLASVTVFLEWIKGVWTDNDNVGRSASSGAEGEEGEEEDPDRVQHVDRDRRRDVELDELSDETRVGNGVVGDEEDNMYGMGLPYPKRRDPDALPPSNVAELMGRWIYKRIVGLTTGNALYAVKAGVLTTLMCIPFFIPGSAQFAYDNRFLWGIVMAQLTSARFRGDTTFGFLTRIFSTFLGGGVGLCMWYICAPTKGHQASPYALGAIFAVCFPFFFYIRLYIPGPPMRILIFYVTTVLVIGYSYQDQFQALPSSPGVGWSVAWRRFLLVACGVFAAFIFSFFPPAFTLRRYQRTALATTCAELGVIYCAVLSLPYSSSLGQGGGNTNDTNNGDLGKQTLGHSEETHAIVARLIAIRSKLGRLKTGKVNVKYEISLRGKWPEERYHTLFDLQMQISYSLSHLLSVIEHLEPAWTRALLSRTRFTDPNFQGDVLAVISMISTSLRTGSPLPQITPCPLVDRFMLKYHGLNVIHKEAEEDYGLPRTLTRETLENEQYLMFCVGVSTAFGIVSRLDRLMVAAKEIVGEQYHIQGIGFGGFGSVTTRREGVPLGSRTSTRM
ncbi:hypothetical protein F5051DRAFT_408806 [Lentinula edodes]|nr:hypothetical protein F5051DRAFT_408806 [Lentinula edodes]